MASSSWESMSSSGVGGSSPSFANNDPCVCHDGVFGVAGVSSVVGLAIVVIVNHVGERVQKQKKATSEGRKKVCTVANKVIYFNEG